MADKQIESLLNATFEPQKADLEQFWLDIRRERNMNAPELLTDTHQTGIIVGTVTFTAPDGPTVTLRWQGELADEQLTLFECLDDPLFELAGEPWVEPPPSTAINHILATPGWHNVVVSRVWPTLATRLYEQTRVSRPTVLRAPD